MKSPVSNHSRRDFLRSSLAFGAVSILPSNLVLGANSSNGRAPSDRVNLAVIGIGNQGYGDLSTMIGSGHCRIVALCDVDMEGGHTHAARYRCGLTDKPPGKDAPPVEKHKAKAYTDFRKMFDEMADEIDAVLIATPDHSHFAATMLAMSLGKHVYVEKPLAHTFGQTARLMAMAEKSGVVTQMGNQGHSGANYFQFKAWVEAGIIKDVTRITAHMNERRRWHGWGATVKEYPQDPMPAGMQWDQWIDVVAAEHPFSRKLHPQEWRSWYDYGSGAFGDWGPHLLDTCHRFLELGLPSKVSVLRRDGANPLVFPQASTIRFDFPERGSLPACEVTWYDGTENRPTLEAEYGSKIGGPGKVIYGKDLTFQGGSHGSPLYIIPKEKFMEMRASLPKFPQKNSNHYANFLLACKGEEEARSPFAVSGPLTQVFNLGVIAQRLGVDLEFDREKSTITNSEAALALMDPAPRKGWEEFYKL